MFSHYILVDWSANSTPKQGRDSIWLLVAARRGREVEVLALDNPPTRAMAAAVLAGRLRALAGSARRILVGFDFPLGFPAGTASRLDLQGRPWQALWRRLATAVVDHADNANNRFAVAADLNRALSGGPWPFWGCPPAHAGPLLAARRQPPPDAAGPAEQRLAERCARGTQPVWKLFGVGSAGSQALLGIPHVLALSRACPGAAVWPFETGLAPPADAVAVTFAEIWPSLPGIDLSLHRVRDAAQLLGLARWLAALDGDGDGMGAGDASLARRFAGPAGLGPDARARIVAEEGWILGAL